MNLETILNGVISGLIGSIGTYLILKIIEKNAINDLKTLIFSDENIKNTLEKMLNNESYQKFLFHTGGFIGKGAKTGVGLDGKMKPEQILMGLAQQWLFRGKNTESAINPIEKPILDKIPDAH